MKLTLGKPSTVQLKRAGINANFNPKAVARLVRKHDAAVRVRMNTALDLAQREVDLLAHTADPPFAIDRKKAEAQRRKLQQELKAVARERPPEAPPSSGHNPNFFPPFFNTGAQWLSGGVVTSPRFNRRPDIGMLALSVAAYPPGGAIDRRLWMGVLYMAESEELLTGAVSTFAGGTVAAFTVLGYARATANLLVSVSAEGAGGFSTTSGLARIGDMNLGVNRIPLTFMTAAARLMVRRGDLVLVSCGLQVTAGCGGIVCAATSNIALSQTTIFVA